MRHLFLSSTLLPMPVLLALAIPASAQSDTPSTQGPVEPLEADLAAEPAALPSQGLVVLTAINDVWLRIYDGRGEHLLEKQMTKGETFTVPANANNPMILTGRPDALAVTVGGRAVAPLGPGENTIFDVPVSAAALLARPIPDAGASSIPPTAAPAGAHAPAGNSVAE